MSSDIKDVLASIDPLPASFSSCFANLCTRDMRHTLYALYSLQETDERDGRWTEETAKRFGSGSHNSFFRQVPEVKRMLL